MEYLASDCVYSFCQVFFHHGLPCALVEDVHDGLHCSTRRPCCRGLLHSAPRLPARALRGSSQCVPQTDAKLGHTVHVKNK